MSVAPTPDTDIARRFSEVRAHIDERASSAVDLVVVTKGHPAAVARAASAAGAVDLGESRAQELETKLADEVLREARPRWHFIGRLQTNKIRKLAGRVHLWHSVDRESVIDELAKRDPGAAMLLQVDFVGEPQKGGCAPVDTELLLSRAVEAGLVVRGLMTIGPAGPPEAAAPAFTALTKMADSLSLEVRSMGMSGDLDIALDHGATMVRVGSTIVGPRS